MGLVVEVSWNNLSDRWKDYFINILHTTARMSKDENTKVGSLIIDTERKVVVSSSWNDLPRGVKHNSERNSRPLKYLYTLHAEQGCLESGKCNYPTSSKLECNTTKWNRRLF